MKLVRKRCLRPGCGFVGKVPETRTRCDQRRFGQGSYACGGTLVRPARHQPGVQAATIPGTHPAPRPQDLAAKQLAVAHRKIGEKARAIADLARLLGEWEARARRLAVYASMTDAQVAALSEARKAAARKAVETRRGKVRRGMRLGGDV